MTAAEATRLAQTDPVPNLSSRWGETVTSARCALADLVTQLRALDDLHDQLAEYKLDVSVDLGPIGNAAAAARRDLDSPHIFQRGQR
jgi:hypothetical protein